jgi:undecaprenyl-diphosphatase
MLAGASGADSTEELHMPRWPIEIEFVRWLASLGGRSWLLDGLASVMVSNILFRSVPYVVLLAGYWSAADTSHERDRAVRRTILGGFVASGVAAIVSQLAQRLWVNPRPGIDPALGAIFDARFRDLLPNDFHAFPSDHAASLVPLVWTVWRLQPWLGAVSAVLLGCVLAARVYTGVHYPTDVLAGVVLGATVSRLERRWPVFARRGLALVDRARVASPVSTAAGLFLIAYCYATMFTDARELLSVMVRALRGLGHL